MVINMKCGNPMKKFLKLKLSKRKIEGRVKR